MSAIIEHSFGFYVLHRSFTDIELKSKVFVNPGLTGLKFGKNEKTQMNDYIQIK